MVLLGVLRPEAAEDHISSYKMDYVQTEVESLFFQGCMNSPIDVNKPKWARPLYGVCVMCKRERIRFYIIFKNNTSGSAQVAAIAVAISSIRLTA